MSPIDGPVLEDESAAEPSAASADDNSTRSRILIATAEVLGRTGTKLSLSEVALEAGISRPTLYRWFASKDELLGAVAHHEIMLFGAGMVRVTAELHGAEKLDAALRFIVEYQRTYSGVRVVDVEPEVSLAQLSKVIPPMRESLQRLLPGPNGAVKAATAVRVAISHYIVRSDDADQFLAQLRHAVGITSAFAE